MILTLLWEFGSLPDWVWVQVLRVWFTFVCFVLYLCFTTVQFALVAKRGYAFVVVVSVCLLLACVLVWFIG